MPKGQLAPLFTTQELRYLANIERRVKGIFAALEVGTRSPRPGNSTFGWPASSFSISAYWGSYLNMMLYEWYDGKKTVTTPQLVQLGEQLLELVGTWNPDDRIIWWMRLQNKTWAEIRQYFKKKVTSLNLRQRYDIMLARAAQLLSTAKVMVVV